MVSITLLPLLYLACSATLAAAARHKVGSELSATVGGERSDDTEKGPPEWWGTESQCESLSTKTRERCGLSLEDIEAKCKSCNASLSKFSKMPSREEHLMRQKYNFCPRGNLEPLQGKFHHLLNPGTIYHYVDEGCNCWQMLPIAESAFHKPWKNYKFVRVNPDCSSMEAEVLRSGLRDDCSLSTEGQKGGSFNFFDPGYDKVKHTSADVMPCAEYGTNYDPPESLCPLMPVNMDSHWKN